MTDPLPLTSQIVLASGSATRRALLEQAGVQVQVISPQIDEDGVKASFQQEGLSARELAEALAAAKAQRVSAGCGNALVIGADQVLECKKVWFSKPDSREKAYQTLRTLSGQSHSLHVAATAYKNGARIWGHTETARLTMRPLSDAFISAYLEDIGDAAFMSVGAYQLEGRGAQLFSRVQGDFFTILGLPLLAVLGFLREHDILPS